MIRVLVNGCRGKMGSQAMVAVDNHPHLTLVAGTDLGDNLEQCIKDKAAQVVVDFTVASAGMNNARTIINSGACPVVGTSGFQEAQVAELAELAAMRKIGGVIAPNFSLGAVLMMRFAEEAAQFLPDVEIVELHHDKKEESPSGTALRTTELIANGRLKSDKKVSHVSTKGVELIAGARGATVNEVAVHSIRLPGRIAHQAVIFGGLGESLTILHDSFSRDSFMPGVCLACEKVVARNSLVYGLEHLLF
jgi:4-hydroxy-tetrahydrodipicolinate reductase